MASLLSGPKKENGRLRGIVPLKEGTPRPGLAMGSFHKKRTEPLEERQLGAEVTVAPLCLKVQLTHYPAHRIY